jgi:hypothetical protein
LGKLGTDLVLFKRPLAFLPRSPSLTWSYTTPQNPENCVTVNFTLTPEELVYFNQCFSILSDGLEINTMIEESCMAILLSMKKKQLKNLSNFVFRVSKKLGEIKEQESGSRGDS